MTHPTTVRRSPGRGIERDGNGYHASGGGGTRSEGLQVIEYSSPSYAPGRPSAPSPVPPSAPAERPHGRRSQSAPGRPSPRRHVRYGGEDHDVRELRRTRRREAASSAFRSDIEGLRALAVLLVVLYHAGVSRVSGGFVGVDVFFVISGFLITSLLLREHDRDGRISIRAFYARRVRRLLPAASLTLVVTTVAASLLVGVARARDVFVDGVWASLFAANVRFATKGTDYLGAQAAPSPLQHFWSLAVEEQFYVVWPAVIIVTGLLLRRASRTTFRTTLLVLLGVVAAASLAWSVYQTAHSATWAYFSTATRAWELAAGALLAMFPTVAQRLPAVWSAVLGWAGLAAVASAALLFTTKTAFPGYAAALPVAGTVALLAAGSGRPRAGVGVVLSLPPMQWIGTLSYSWYLWHWPALVLAAAYAGRDLAWWEGLIVSAGSLVVAAAAYHAVENPVRTSKALARNVRLSLVAGLAITAVGVLATTVGVLRTGSALTAARAEYERQVAAELAAPPLTDEQIREQVARSARGGRLSSRTVVALPSAPDDQGPHKDCQADRDDLTVPAPDECVFGAPDGLRTAVLFGDSHAMMWEAGLHKMAAQRGWRLVILTKSGCAVHPGPIFDNTLGREYTECATWKAAALDRIGQLDPDLVLVASNARVGGLIGPDGQRQDVTDEAWERGLAETLGTLDGIAGDVALIGDIPRLEQSAPDCLGAHPNKPKVCATSTRKAVDDGLRAAERSAATTAGAMYVDVTDWLCTERTCPATVGDTVAYYNQLHVSASLALKVAGELADRTGLTEEL